MRKLISVLLACLLLSLSVCGFAEAAAPRLAALNGPTAIGMAQLLTADNVYAAADELVPRSMPLPTCSRPMAWRSAPM